MIPSAMTVLNTDPALFFPYLQTLPQGMGGMASVKSFSGGQLRAGVGSGQGPGSRGVRSRGRGKGRSVLGAVAGQGGRGCNGRGRGHRAVSPKVRLPVKTGLLRHSP